jgi:hypothetical protein
LGTVWQVCSKKIHAKSGGVSSHNTSSNAAEPFHVCSGLWLRTVWQVCSKYKPKSMVFPARMPHPNVAEPFQGLHMDPMSDVSMCNQLLVAHLCLHVPCFGLRLGTVLAGVQQKNPCQE